MECAGHGMAGMGTKGVPSGYQEWVQRGYRVDTKVKWVMRGYRGGMEGVTSGYQVGTKWVPGVGTKRYQEWVPRGMWVASVY